MLRESLRPVDVVVITSLWSLKFYDTWLQTLFNHSAEVIYGEYLESVFVTRYLLLLFFIKCAIACVIALIADAYNHKFFVCFGGLCLYTLTPILALCMCITRLEIFVLLTALPSMFLFVTSPATFCLIFIQRRSPSRRQVRILVAIMECVEGLVDYLIFLSIPEKATPNEQFSMIASWVVVIPFIVLALTIIERIRKYVSPDHLKEKGVTEIIQGIKRDMGTRPHTGQSAACLLIFVLLLFPAFSLSALGAVVDNLKPEGDTQFQHPSLKGVILLAKLTFIPLAEVAIALAPIKEVKGEMLVLGLAHIINIAVLTLLVVKMSGIGAKSVDAKDVQSNLFSAMNHSTLKLDNAVNTEVLLDFGNDMFDYSSYMKLRDERVLSSGNDTNKVWGFENSSVEQLVASGNSILDEDYADFRQGTPFPPPVEGRYMYYMSNPSSVDIDVRDDPLGSFISNNINLLKKNYAFFGNQAMSNKEITVKLTMTPQPLSLGLPPFERTFTFKEKQLYFLFVVGDKNDLDVLAAGGDLEIPKFVVKPILIVQNTFVGSTVLGVVLGPDHEIEVRKLNGEIVDIKTLPDRTKALPIIVPAGKLRLRAAYRGVNPTLVNKLTPVEEEVEIQPSSVSIQVLNLETTYSFGGFYNLFETEPPPVTAQPPPIEKPDAVLVTTYAMFGASIGVTSVGYVHFFWIGSPGRLRSTLFAWFLVSKELTGWLAAYVVGNDIHFNEAVGLLTLQVVTAIWHAGFGLYYEHNILPHAAQQKNQPASE